MARRDQDRLADPLWTLSPRGRSPPARRRGPAALEAFTAGRTWVWRQPCSASSLFGGTVW